MADTLEGFPFWPLHFDEHGQLTQPAADAFLQEVSARNPSDLFVFSHGWNNNEATAMKLYTGFFGEVSKIMNDPSIPKRPGAVVCVAGVIWPSILFPGEAATINSGGAASFGNSQPVGTLESELPKVFNRPDQQEDLQDLMDLIREQPPDNNCLLAVRDKLSSLLTKEASQNTTATGQDDLEFRAVTVTSNDAWLQILDMFSVQPAGDGTEGGGATDFGSFFGRLWNGAKNALRVATYWGMKNRAGIVGKNGLGPLLGRLHQTAPNVNIHLLGHSFGARLVSYTLAGLPATAFKGRSPVKSLFLLQGAFSHFAFADAIPFDQTRQGDLAGMAARVDGPLLATHSLKDLAVGNAYPAASILAGQDASDATDLMYRWEGMGHDGAQAVHAQTAVLGSAGTTYSFEPGKWINLDGNQVIVNGGPPSGAHSDIIHSETAWAALAAAKVAGVGVKTAGG